MGNLEEHEESVTYTLIICYSANISVENILRFNCLYEKKGYLIDASSPFLFCIHFLLSLLFLYI